jgi:hypothetical protein
VCDTFGHLMCRHTLLVVAIAGAVGCGKDEASTAKKPSNNEGRGKLVGIYPEKWTCDQIATVEKVSELLGGPAHVNESPVLPPPGVPRPCNYMVGEPPVPWTFDIDCREGYKQRADALFEQYQRTSGEMVNQYNIMADAKPIETGTKPAVDAAPHRAPEAAREVPVGAKGLDHHGQGLLFIDDDAPCYVRVVGPDADRRLALAQHIVQALTLANAPMEPRAAP